MNVGVRFNSGQSLNTFEAKITVRSKSVAKVVSFVDEHFDSEGKQFETRMNSLGKAKAVYVDCICYLEEINDWKAFFFFKTTLKRL